MLTSPSGRKFYKVGYSELPKMVLAWVRGQLAQQLTSEVFWHTLSISGRGGVTVKTKRPLGKFCVTAQPME